MEATQTITPNPAYEKFCEVAKDLGVSDETIDLIKKDLRMTDSDSETEGKESTDTKPEAKVVEVSVEKTETSDKKSSPIMDMLSQVIKSKGC